MQKLANDVTPLASYLLTRRGHQFGEVFDHAPNSTSDALAAWQNGKPVFLPNCCSAELTEHYKDIAQSHKLYEAILDEQECDAVLANPPYSQRLDKYFEPLGSSVNEGDSQEIETVLFDAIDGDEVLAEDLWLKVSWLSFYEEDASLRFRFSFGVDNVEDVAADKQRQHYAALLTDAVFPESRLITQNKALKQQLCEVLDCRSVTFVERIIYFNSPDGGAYLHHDRERGHAGVVYAQLSGHTYWLALAKHELMAEITAFVNQSETKDRWPESISTSQRQELIDISRNSENLSVELESFSNDALIQLINETESFVQQLIANGHGRVVNPGDVLLLPQETDMNCCWHSVFCLGEESGEALSFAIRSA